MLNWLWKMWGFHVCEEFTQWSERRWQCERAATFEEWMGSGCTVKKVKYTSRVQERSCTICGKIEQRRLEI